MTVLTNKTIQQCKIRLLETRAEIINRMNHGRNEHSQRDRSGDEVDASAELLAENQFLATHGRLKSQLIEIDFALDRIEKGSYGICVETEEFIEEARLLAIPWTKLSIEGAEIREAKEKIFA